MRFLLENFKSATMLFILIGIIFPLLMIAVVLRIRRLQRMGGSIEARNAKRWPPTAQKVFRAMVHGVALIGILLVLLTPNRQYDWMCGKEEWGGAPPASCAVPDDPSDDGVLFAGVLLAIVVAVQLILAACANNRREVILPAVFIVLAVCAWGFS
jgi:hypothetical protein